ncbi:putative LysM domain GPI-anchored protein 1 precursor [Tripterygium wilfordii]|uniref:Putative LysM domain GPI-anchored protein 1 n=2 Tax=Tripterygium wilfordii TaxID=458696 RepID=A0A7J7C897_TRIWF|nr:putative LysM domain GPI-anchored protein 1 precursor [Tripterygium wilfordii]
MNSHQEQVLSLLLFMIITVLPSISQSRSVIEPCSTSHSCSSLLSYILPYDSKLSEIAFRFHVDLSNLISTNSINSTLPVPSISNQILHAKTLVKVPISCPCVDGIRRSMSTTYTVRAVDTVDSISISYGGLVSAQQIRSVNGIDHANDTLMIGESIVIPLPCTCFNGANNGVKTVYMSYVVQDGESLKSVAERYGSSVVDLEDINELQQPYVYPGDVLSVPISACSSASLNWYNETILVVPNGSYALTASNCIKCLCGPNDL